MDGLTDYRLYDGGIRLIGAMEMVRNGAAGGMTGVRWHAYHFPAALEHGAGGC